MTKGTFLSLKDISDDLKEKTNNLIFYDKENNKITFDISHIDNIIFENIILL